MVHPRTTRRRNSRSPLSRKARRTSFGRAFTRAAIKPRQNSNTDQLIFGVPQLIEFISQSITLEPGDVIATGTPSGVGFARKPPVFLKPGDEMEVLIEGMGGLGNPVVAEQEN